MIRRATRRFQEGDGTETTAARRPLYTVVLLLCLLMPAMGHATTLNVPDEFLTIQSAIDSASVGDTVLVAPGVYSGEGNRDLSYGGKEVVVRSAEGLEATIIQCHVSSRGSSFTEGESRDAILEGFTITYGVAVEEGGAGILCVESSPTIRDCRVEFGLSVSGGAAGIHCEGGSPLISDCVLEFNDSFGGDGGGLSCLSTSAVIRRCSIEGNRAERGGGIFISGGSVTVEDCEVVSNRAGLDPPEGVVPQGGGIHATNGTIADCVICDNWALEGAGGGFYGDAFLTRCAITGNHASGSGDLGVGSGGGILSGTSTHIYQCTISGNRADVAGDGIQGNGTLIEQSISWGHGACGDDILSLSEMTIVCCCFETLAGEGPIHIIGGQVNEDPLFCDPQPCWIAPFPGGDYRLQSGSPCLSGNSPCGDLIGALPVGCPVSSASEVAPRDEGSCILGLPSPNPVRSEVGYTIRLEQSEDVRLRLLDIRGRRIGELLDRVLPGGTHSFSWNLTDAGGASLPSGVYYLRLEAGGMVETRKIVIRR